MKTSKLMKTVCVAGLTVACAWSLAACSSSNASTGGVAATVNGTEISEDTITTYIESFRASSDLTDEAAWGEWMAENSLTPSGVREEVIDSYVSRELIKTGAQEKGITVDSSEVDSYVSKTKSNYSSDEAWQAALSSAGMTEDEYRAELELQLKSKGLQESFAADGEVTEEQIMQYASMYASAYTGAKKSSHILFAADDQATAQEVLDKINSGELDFAEAAKQYSTDTASAANGGNVGWDVLNSFVTAYTDALDQLSEGQVSGLVTSDYGIHIIKCTQVFTAPEEVTSSSQLPSEFVDAIKSTVQSSSQSTAYSDWFTSYKESADIVINDMPSGLPYDLDMTKYQTDSSTDSTATDATTTDSTSTSTTTDSSSATTSTDGTTASTDSASTSESSASSGETTASN